MASNVDYEAFLLWAENKFGRENIKFRRGGKEICTHSIFADDHKFHLWMNPEGGKKEKEGGGYRCWYTNRMGSLVSLVAELDNIPFEQAEDLICTTPSLRALEQKVHNFYESAQDVVETPVVRSDLELPPFTYNIDLMEGGEWRDKAIAYLEARKIPIDGMYVCTRGDYRNRIVIPYYDKSNKLVYYNARTMSKDDAVMRYRKPDDKNLLQEEFLYCYTWPKPGKKIYLMEGEFDARAINLADLYSAACGGKSLSDIQAGMLRNYIPVLAFDTDSEGKDWGQAALIEIGMKLLEMGFPEVYYVRPPRAYKDWNKVHIEKGSSILRKYIEANERRFTAWTVDQLNMKG